MAKRRKLTDQFKAKVGMEAFRGDRTIQEIGAKHQVHLLPAGNRACESTYRGLILLQVLSYAA